MLYNRSGITRRALLRAGAGAGLLAALPARGGADAAAPIEVRLRPRPADATLIGGGYPQTPVWAYNGALPGPPIRLALGQRLRAVVDNGLDEDTSVHCHGIRLPNAMDGVPGLTQPPIRPGESFVYEFTPPDAGTYWYHPHANSAEQTGRGLSGALIVDEPELPAPADGGFDRDLVWLLDDWRLDRSAAIAPFGDRHDMTHGGRIGNTVTLNGRVPGAVPVRAGERLRLRLINAATARHFALYFEDHEPLVVALDGQPVPPHAPDGGRVVIAPAQRVDLLLDAVGAPGATSRVIDYFYRDAFLAVELVYAAAPPLRSAPAGDPPGLGPARLPEPDLVDADRHRVVLEGGAMGGMRGATLDGAYADIRALVGRGAAWALNGVVRMNHDAPPLFRVARGRSVRLTLRNDTRWPHPMHLHGHHFRVLSRNGRDATRPEWRDTVLLRPRDQVDVAFVADNPGRWMFHCHIPEHMYGGMMAVVEVV